MKLPDSETLAVIGIVVVAGLAVAFMQQPDSVISAIAGGLLGYLKGQETKQ